MKKAPPSAPFIPPPGVIIARERSPPHRSITFSPVSRTFFWYQEPKMTFDKLAAYGEAVITLNYACLTPEEISANIDDDTMAKCLAMAINPAR